MRVSFSAMDCFIRCPLQYKYAYIDRIKGPEKPVLFFGSLIHEVVQYALKKDPFVPSVEELLDLYKNRWNEKIFTDKKESDTYFNLGENMIRNFHSSHQPGLRDIVAIEKRFQMPLGEHIIAGQIDRIDKLPHGPFEIIDYKTNSKLPTRQEIDDGASYKMQLGIYQMATNYSWPEAKEIKITLYFLKFNEKISTARVGLELEEIKEKVLKTIDEIEKAVEKMEFKAKPGYICDWCDFNDRCPYTKHKFNKPEKETTKGAQIQEEKIDDLVGEYINLQKRHKELEQKIHDHFDREKMECFYHKDGIVTRSKQKFSIRQPEK